MRRFATFAEFYPFYLGEHANPVCRRLHVAGTLATLAALIAAAVTRDARWLVAAPLVGYGFAWIGHFFYERNRPATFRHPLYSLAADFVMFSDVLRGRVKL
ncbi:MAG TPA: Mpo1-like protein [Casimicrobiaceae bacterium]|nr:Mpo1-like protein [Casimicrobiaceae bacterium]